MLWTTIAAFLLPLAAAAEPLTLSSVTPLAQCQRASVVWAGGEAPYTVSVTTWTPQSRNTLQDPTRVLGRTPDHTFEWEVNYARDTQLFLRVADAGGRHVYSARRLVVGDGPLSCEFFEPPLMGSASSRLLPSASSAAPWNPMSAPVRSRPAWEPQTGDPIFPQTQTKEEERGPDVGLIVGTTVAGVAVLAIILGLLVWVRQLRKKVAALRKRIAEHEAPATAKLAYESSVASQSSEAL